MDVLQLCFGKFRTGFVAITSGRSERSFGFEGRFAVGLGWFVGRGFL